MSQMDTPDGEKRRYQRFENRSLAVDIARPGIQGIIKTNPTAECLNFSRTGLQFDCPQKLKDGEKLTIDISVDDIVLRDLSAMVVSSQSIDNGNWCYGARFCLEYPRMKKDNIYRNLLLIEEKLKRSNEYPFDAV